jgi:hypothetical protein
MTFWEIGDEEPEDPRFIAAGRLRPALPAVGQKRSGPRLELRRRWGLAADRHSTQPPNVGPRPNQGEKKTARSQRVVLASVFISVVPSLAGAMGSKTARTAQPVRRRPS